MAKESKDIDEEEKIIFENKFELIAIAAKRARNLRDGGKPLVEKISDKEPVIALKEVLSGQLEVEITRKNKSKASGS